MNRIACLHAASPNWILSTTYSSPSFVSNGPLAVRRKPCTHSVAQKTKTDTVLCHVQGVCANTYKGSAWVLKLVHSSESNTLQLIYRPPTKSLRPILGTWHLQPVSSENKKFQFKTHGKEPATLKAQMSRASDCQGEFRPQNPFEKGQERKKKKKSLHFKVLYTNCQYSLSQMR